MKRYDTARLVKDLPRAHGVHDDDVDEQGREVYVELRSVTRGEFYNAYNAGLQPEIVVYLAIAEDYDDERTVILHDKRYRVIRTFYTTDDGIELTLQRSDIK